MELQGGSVTASSPGVGKGSTFSVSMPLLSGEDAMAIDTTPTGPVTSISGLKILIADDNADGLESLALLLSGLGATVVAASGGAEAIEKWRAERPDLILMDVGMPGVDGLQAAREIRRMSRGHGPGLIALTGWGRDEDRALTLNAGFDGHLVKPVRLEELEETVKRILPGLTCR